MNLSDIIEHLIVLMFLVVFPTCAARIAWNQGSIGRRRYFFEVFKLGFLVFICNRVLIRSDESWIVLIGFCIALYLGWRICKCIGSRLKDMGWPQWTCLFSGLPIFWILVLFWPAGRRIQGRSLP